MDGIGSITIEIRPRLQICNAFIQLLSKDKIETNEAQIKLSEDSITLLLKNEIVNIFLKFIQISPCSISALSVKNNWISFHVNMKSHSSFGSFNTGLVTNHMPKIPFLSKTLHSTKFLEDHNCVILCSCCKNSISKKLHFERVLPLPDSDYDPSEWFCCRHDNNNVGISLSPKESDLLYGPFFVVVHINVITSNISADNNTLICTRCLQHLGQGRKNSYQLWNSCIAYELLKSATVQPATDPLKDFFIAFNTQATGSFGEEIIFQNLAQKEDHFLLLKPMDWNLDLIVEPCAFDNTDHISLKKISVIKILYKYITNKNSIPSNSWTIKYCDVSLYIIQAGLKHLLSATKRFPEMYRIAANGYYIGYLELEQLRNIV